MSAAVTLAAPRRTRGEDGAVHFSDLKRLAFSPAHYLYGLTRPRETTKAMRIGTIVDRMLLGGDMPPIFDGERRGKKWEEYAARYPDPSEIVTASEYEDAAPIAGALRTDPANAEALKWITGKHQVPLEWEMQGVKFSTRGVDTVGEGWISDLKVTNSAHPDRFAWHARRMFWHVQIVAYAEACRQNGIATGAGLFIVGAESSPPYPATVLKLTPRTIEAGQKTLHLWIESLRACESSGEWPGYVQSVVDLDTPDELQLEGVEDE